MPRKPRLEVSGGTHHVVARGNAGEVIVLDDRDRRAFFARLGQAVEQHRWSCLAYCLLDNHVHLIVETPEPNLGLGMKLLKSAYAQDFNYRHQRRGHVFGGRFHSVPIDHDAHLVQAIIYVSLNPVRAGMVARPEQWPWSSYGATVGLSEPAHFLNVPFVLELVDPNPDTARKLLEAAVDESATISSTKSRGQTRRVRPPAETVDQEPGSDP